MGNDRSGEAPPVAQDLSGVTVCALRAERKELEMRIYRCCQEFQKRTGLCVVALCAETQTVHPLSGSDDQTFLIGVRVGVESV